MSTGFSEEQLEKFYNILKENVIKDPLPDYRISRETVISIIIYV